MLFGLDKLEWSGYPMTKNFNDMFSRFDRNRHVMDRQTDILPQYGPCYAYASRGKKGDICFLV